MYERFFKSFLFPLYETVIKRRSTLSYLKSLNANQWMSKAALEETQWRDLKLLLAHAYENSPYYRDLFDELKITPEDIESPLDFQNFPICNREDVVANSEKMVADNYKNRTIRKSTGGSTGKPVHFALDQNSYEWRMATTQRGYGWAHCEAGSKTLYIWGVDVGNPTRWQQFKTAIYHRAYNRKMFNCFDFDDEEMLRCIEYINKKKPNGIVAFTSAVYNLAKFIASHKLSVHPVPSVITGAEKLYDHQRELIEDIFGGKVFNTYGCREFMLIAAECEKHEGLHVSMDNLFVEIIKDGKPAAPGESGDVVVTDLHNYGMPFIRYKNGDIAVQGGESCSCGRGLPLIKNVDGRKLDEIVATDGKVVSGGFFPHLMKEFKEVEKFQVIQTAKDKLQIKLILNQQFPDSQIETCKEEIWKVLGRDMDIHMDIVPEIPLTPAGKFRVTISKIANQTGS